MKTSLRNDSKSRRSRREDESSVFHQQTHPARTAEQRSKQREEKQPGGPEGKAITGDKGDAIGSVSLEFPSLCLAVEANAIILSDVLPEIC